MINHLDFTVDSNGEHIYYRLFAEGRVNLKDSEIIIDPSFLHHLLFEDIQENEFTFYAPDTIVDLINRAKEGAQERGFLLGFLNFWGETSLVETNPNWGRFFENINRMRFVSITEEMITSGQENNEFNFFLEQFIDHPFFTTFSPLKNVLGDCVGKILLHSKKTGKKILSKTRRLFKLVREKITALELPKRLSNTLEFKKNIASKLTSKIPGKGNSRFFVGLAIAVGGIWWTPVSVVGVAYAMLDP